MFLAHPDFVGHVSMPRFHGMLLEGMRKRGHRVMTLTPKPIFHSLPSPEKLKKWLGYIDQYLIFPAEVKKEMKLLPDNTLFVFTDNSLGPWVPLASNLPHVIHCHDFMAQQAALGQIEEQKIKWSGRQYQKMIRNGYSSGVNFISGSECTRRNLLKFLPSPPRICELVYNGLYTRFERYDSQESRATLSKQFGLDLSGGYLLHVGGNQWYKNRIGVIEIYNAWRRISSIRLPLLLIGLKPSTAVRETYEASPYKDDIHFISNANNQLVNKAYSGATVFLFPSKAEGFGWPVAEAMASGCLVVTTDEAPMTEVAGDAGFYIPRRPNNGKNLEWAKDAGLLVERIVSFNETERAAAIEAGLNNARRFDTDEALDKIEEIYYKIVDEHRQK
ncbi:glycosyltransferase [Chryseolinea sp. T2]|uniref:glycosyltransferase n=1 Tax=Chryseolinea sp. T2 TaxID=3129255 RepID=UPI003076EA6D